MPILRHTISTRFTTLPNASIRDDRLSLRDVGLLAFMMSMPDNWEFSLNGLAKVLPHDGRHTVNAGVQALKTAGYLSIKQERFQGGKLGNVVWTISDIPQFGNQTTAPQSDLPTTGKPQAGNRLQTKNHNGQKTICIPPSDRFDEFWTAYPRKIAKKDARKAFAKLKPKDIDKILAALDVQKKAWTDPQFIPYPATWLNGERWDDDLRPEQQKADLPQYEEYVGEDGRIRHRRVST